MKYIIFFSELLYIDKLILCLLEKNKDKEHKCLYAKVTSHQGETIARNNTAKFNKWRLTKKQNNKCFSNYISFFSDVHLSFYKLFADINEKQTLQKIRNQGVMITYDRSCCRNIYDITYISLKD